MHYSCLFVINTDTSVFKPCLPFQIETQNQTLNSSMLFLWRECWGMTDQPCMSTTSHFSALKVKGLVLHRSPNLHHTDSMNCITRSVRKSCHCLSVSFSSLPPLSLGVAAIMQNSQVNTAKCELMYLSFKLRIGYVSHFNITWGKTDLYYFYPCNNNFLTENEKRCSE